MFSKTRILSAIVMIAVIAVVALVDNFLINFAIFGVLLFLAFNEAKAM
ncbi:TPA: phosphatidate cytidylyltransferase, partial [Campylobacter lari]|nr:phosphatidate cytidylyltransferase [Campylobacter lari]